MCCDGLFYFSTACNEELYLTPVDSDWIVLIRFAEIDTTITRTGK